VLVAQDDNRRAAAHARIVPATAGAFTLMVKAGAAPIAALEHSTSVWLADWKLSASRTVWEQCQLAPPGWAAATPGGRWTTT
jgi:hypothetical protein